MTSYLLGVYEPYGDAPPPENLDAIMDDVRALTDEMRAAGVWVFAAGLHPPETATVVRDDLPQCGSALAALHSSCEGTFAPAIPDPRCSASRRGPSVDDTVRA
jgi:hypothetical protein